MIINTTPHAINLPDRTIPPSGDIVRVSVKLADAGEFDGIPLVKGTYGEVTGLPPEKEGVMYIVSALVRAALPNRKDLASPAKLVRDDKGNITGCSALEIS
jgi:hypothetical protein